MPRIASACASASSASLASLMPPALPRPPIWTWALTTTGKPSASAACAGLLGVGGVTALRHGYAVLGEELFSLVFEKVHLCFAPPGGADCLGTAAQPPAGAARYQQSEDGGTWHYPRSSTFVSLEVYGTLIDWETGIYEAFQREADKDGFTIDRDQLIPLFLETQREIMSGSYELYAEVLRRTAVEVAEELGWELEPVRSSFLPNSIPSWPPFRDTNALLERLKKKYQIGLISNIDDKLLGATRRHFRVDFDLVVTAQQVRSYKPDPAHFKECQAPDRPEDDAGSTSRPASRPT